MIIRYTNDVSFERTLRNTYFRLKSKQIKDQMIIIDFSNNNFVLLKSLNFLFCFICAIKTNFYNLIIKIKLFNEKEIINFEKYSSSYSDNHLDLDRIMISKLLFQETSGFLKLIQKLDIRTYPDINELREIKEKHNIVRKNEKHGTSISIMPLTEIVSDSITDNIYISKNMDRLCLILVNNIPTKIDKVDAEYYSKHILFELIKNVYQHSLIKNDDIPRGMVSAHLYKYPNIKRINNEELINHKDEVTLVQSWINFSRRSEQDRIPIEFLTITIDDYGVGLINNINNYYEKSHNISSTLTPKELIFKAITTRFTTKTVHDNSQDIFYTENAPHALTKKGYGFLWCLYYIAKYYGKMKLCTSKYILLLSSKLDPNFTLSENNMNNMSHFYKLIENKFDSLFECKFIEDKDYSKSNPKNLFPGTQISIEFPIMSISQRGWS